MKITKLIAILGAVLFVSLSINVFMAGMVVGSSVSIAPDALTRDRQMQEALSDADKAALKQAMDVNRKKITQLHDDLEKTKQGIRDIIRKEPMDEKALGDALEEEKNKKLQLLRLVHETRGAAMAKMSPEGQAMLSKIDRLGFNLSDSNAQCR